jgi:hypothetical protein
MNETAAKQEVAEAFAASQATIDRMRRDVIARHRYGFERESQHSQFDTWEEYRGER